MPSVLLVEKWSFSMCDLMPSPQMSGYRYTQTKEGFADDLRKAKERREPATMRWTEFLKTKGKKIRKVPHKPTSVKTVRAEREAFKNNVRTII